MNSKAAIREAQRTQSNREELVERIARVLPADGTLDVSTGFRLARSSSPTEPIHSLYQPAFCVVAQGRKQALLGEEVFRYDSGHYLIYTVDLPLTFRVEEASKQRPYLGLRLNLDSALVASVMIESEMEPKKGNAGLKAMNVSPMDANLLDAVVRLVRLLDTPGESKVLAPLIIREIVFRLLADGQGARLSHLLTAGKDTQRISKAIGLLRRNFAQSLKMDDLAHELGMSVSGFHHHFKSVTAMSPLQFQKQIRLQEARRLMLGEDLDAASAGFRVGYDDPSYFSREYKKLFGAPPQRDIARLRSNLAL
ncbi:MAG TPA: AraC family transcriptional regulator [Blastocatellia bacterium]|nr:AraC family transcriptional regulator [Blastocatellia bacterium]HMV84094.1 AraC family transcriptional regulator [Blastocatellia bacterium]HMX27395.1 AraC family transcriptional regulator [Blastocatellia bacterium]HMY73990.1 AraC family transcriptional regulator [Blastocatellia bacterium]HMZ16842.1 AraC family transcriptional regulator [Blastocatellia bacterium]